MDRRSFIKGATLAPAALCFPQFACDSESEFEGGNTEESVIIIGAGAAGLSAAFRLGQLGYTNVTILEARSRVGGRIWTTQAWPETELDLGASWIHGIDGNPLSDLAQDTGISWAWTDYENILRYGPSGQQLSSSEQRRLLELEQEAERALGQVQSGTSLQQVLDSLLAGRTSDDRVMIHYLVNSIVEHEFAADLADLAPLALDYGEEFGGGDVIFPNGYLEVFSQYIDTLDIQTEMVVRSVRLESGGVAVTAGPDSADADPTRFRADRVIVTLPLGVLQGGHVEFDPPLPAAKRSAIAQLGMGLLNKVYFRFPDAFWPTEPDVIAYLSPNPGEWTEWLNMAHYLDQPILLGFNAGRFAREIESWSDEQIVASGMDTLRTIYGLRIPEPEAVLITRWASDLYALGSYSFLRPGATEQTIQTLGAPVQARLFFAGEATSLDYPSTVHGAHISGIREANRIAQL